MLPILFRIGDFPVHSYGVLIAAGFLLCVWLSKREAARIGLPGERIVDLGFWSLLVGMLGARILFIITRWSYFREYPLEMFYVWEGGLVFYGGPIVALPFHLWYCRKYALPVRKVLDLAAVAIPIAHAFGRLGCLSAGCCHGKATGGSWGIILNSELVEPHLRGIPLHPTQIYEAASLFGLFFYLAWRRHRKKFDGELALTYVIAYSIIRSVIEIFRGDSIRGFVIDGWLSTSQFISVLAVVAAIVAWISMKQTAERGPSA
ncbi:MAG: prolipoprotein diacylglyceryl transferase [Deltaproteobacteria bacterium]|nr:prolipoprotein diacylglyceryl transferase [Deltaproteobacteria bacterium]